jgi:hypothetical protein
MSTLAPPPGYTAASVQLLACLLVGPLVAGLLVGLVPDAPAAARHLVPLALAPEHPSAGQVLGLWGANLRAAAMPLLGAVALTGLRLKPRQTTIARALLDAFLTVSVAVNAALLALSLGGYGALRLAPWLPHVPAELGAMAVSITAYRHARRAPLLARQLAVTAALTAALLAIAALLETYATPHV